MLGQATVRCGTVSTRRFSGIISCSASEKTSVKLLAALGPVCLLALTPPRILSAASEDPAMVLIVVNDATPPEPGTGALGASEYTGRYYAQARRIPLENIFHINTRTPSDPHSPDSWRISWDEFDSQIREPLRKFLERDGLKDRIKYVVTTYGVPSHISSYRGYENLSVDSFLASVFSPLSDEVSSPNPAFSADPGGMQPHRLPLDRVYAVTRLDGPSAELAVSLVERALRAERGITRTSGIGYFDYRGHSGSAAGASAEESVHQAAALCQEAGMDCQLNTRGATGAGISSAPNALWAWGSPTEGLPPGPYSFAPGAVGAQLAPDSAGTLRSTETGALVPVWVSGGITATWGASSQPSTDLYANGDNLLNHLWSGYSFGESAYLATPSLNWKMIFLGDPLYTLVLTDSAPRRKGAPAQADTLNSDLSGKTVSKAGDSMKELASTSAMVGQTAVAATVNLSLGSGSATAGSAVSLSLTLASVGGALPAALQWTLNYSADVTNVTVVAGGTASGSGKSVVCNGSTCLVYGLNATTIADGIVAVVTFNVASKPSATTIPILVSAVVVASGAGDAISAGGNPGVVTVVSGPAPSAVSVSPNSGSGVSQSFTFTFSDAQSAANLTALGMLFST